MASEKCTGEDAQRRNRSRARRHGEAFDCGGRSPVHFVAANNGSLSMLQCIDFYGVSPAHTGVLSYFQVGHIDTATIYAIRFALSAYKFLFIVDINLDTHAVIVDNSSMKSPHEYRNKNFERPFQKNTPIHIIFRSELAKGTLSMRAQPHARWLREYLPGLCRWLHVELMHWSNNGNHLHLLIRTTDSARFHDFLRALPGRIARQVLGQEELLGTGIRYWTSRPYSRIITWGRELRSVVQYIERNIWEAAGKIRYQDRKVKLSQKLRTMLEKSVKERKQANSRQLLLW